MKLNKASRRYAHSYLSVDSLLEGAEAYVLLEGDCGVVLQAMPEQIIDCVITSPPYWQMREYDVHSSVAGLEIGAEPTPAQYVENLVRVFDRVKRVLKPDGSLWLNLGDKYHNKNLVGIPWRVAIALQERGWILRNDVIWDQRKGTQSPKDRLRDTYEHVFHFVQQQKYYYDADAIRIKPTKLPTVNGHTTISATGVSGVKYRQQIESSAELSPSEKKAALRALDETIAAIRAGKLVDFRMTIRGTQRTYHGDKTNISGRAKELQDKGFFVLKSSAKGYLPSDIWRIVPEDTWRKDAHYAVFPEELLLTPILATSRPKAGIILDPFCGTGSTVAAALKHGRRAIGIDLSHDYLVVAEKRLASQVCLLV